MFKTYYDYVFDSDSFDNDFGDLEVDSFSSVYACTYTTDTNSTNSFPGTEPESNFKSEFDIFYNNLLSELDLFIEKLKIFEKVFSNCISDYSIDPKGKYYAFTDSETKTFFPEIEIFKKKNKTKGTKDIKNMVQIKFKNSLVYSFQNRFYTDYFLKIK